MAVRSLPALRGAWAAGLLLQLQVEQAQLLADTGRLGASLLQLPLSLPQAFLQPLHLPLSPAALLLQGQHLLLEVGRQSLRRLELGEGERGWAVR